jgi:hypothetical protein
MLLGHTKLQAQEADSVSIVADSVGSMEDLIAPPAVEESWEEENAAKFELVSPADRVVVNTRKLDDSAVNKLRNDDDFWYVNEVQKKEKPKQPKESLLDKLAKEKWFRNLLWILVVGGFVAVLIWFIISSDIQLFRRKSPTVTQSQEDEWSNQSIYDIYYDAEIQKTIAAQNLRLAVRLLYLQTLKDLSERNIINYKQEHTNSDYLTQLYNTTYFKDFFRLTRHFEYVWYGQFQLTPASFEVVQQDFFTFKQRFLS